MNIASGSSVHRSLVFAHQGQDQHQSLYKFRHHRSPQTIFEYHNAHRSIKERQFFAVYIRCKSGEFFGVARTKNETY